MVTFASFSDCKLLYYYYHDDCSSIFFSAKGRCLELCPATNPYKSMSCARMHSGHPLRCYDCPILFVASWFSVKNSEFFRNFPWNYVQNTKRQTLRCSHQMDWHESVDLWVMLSTWICCRGSFHGRNSAWKFLWVHTSDITTARDFFDDFTQFRAHPLSILWHSSVLWKYN